MKTLYKLNHQKLPADLGFLKTTNINSITKSPKTGVETMFFQISPRRGLKMFPTKGQAQRAVSRQKKFCRKGLAPKVFGNLGRIIVRKPPRFDWDDEDFNRSEVLEFKRWTFAWFYETEVANIDYRKYDLISANFYDKVIDAGYPDLHNENVGFIGDKPVIIDFGDVSWLG